MCMKATTPPRALEYRFRPRDERKACGAQAGVNFVAKEALKWKGEWVKKSLGGRAQLWYSPIAFVDLVKPLDSMKGLRVTNSRPFCFTAGGVRDANSLKKKRKHKCLKNKER